MPTLIITLKRPALAGRSASCEGTVLDDNAAGGWGVQAGAVAHVLFPRIPLDPWRVIANRIGRAALRLTA